MSILFTWLIVSIIMMAFCCYIVGSTVNEKEEIFPVLFVSGAASLFWPMLLVAAIVAGPFVIPYKLGVRRKKINQEKKKMWKTLQD